MVHIWDYICNMSRSEFWGYYFLLGLITALVNGFIRKLDDDPLLGLIWITLWPLTPIGYIARLIEWVYDKVKAYQPLRRLRIIS